MGCFGRKIENFPSKTTPPKQLLYFIYSIMMQTNYYFFGLILGIFFITNNTFAQTVNFDETWKEFLDNNKISNMSELIKPNKVHDQIDYAKYLLMNTNSCFCQSEIEDAENFMAEIHTMDPRLHKAIPKFVMKMEDLETKIKAYHSMDAIWERFLQTKTVKLEELDAVKSAKSVCEKQTLAKYSYMTVYTHFCQGNISKAKDILENRTLRLTEKTSLRVEDIKGLAPEVAKMKSLFQDMTKLETAWNSYIKTGKSSGFDIELPLFPCNPIPNIKALVLQGVADVCDSGSDTFEQIKKLKAESSVAPNRELEKKVKELKAAIEENKTNLTVLNKAWKDFIPNNEIKGLRKYAYEYCTKEPLIRAYIMDGFGNVCGLAEEMLEKIDELRQPEILDLEQITMIKINELAELSDQYKADVGEIESLWKKFVAQGDTLTGSYELAEFYCDNVHQVKSWVIKGLNGTCENGNVYLEQIDELQETFEFNFEEDLDCRVQKLRIKVWDCRHQALVKLARLETGPDASHEERLAELMAEYGMEERPEVCLDE